MLKKKIIYLLIFLSILFLVYFFTPKVVGYFDFKKIAKAVSTMPWQFGGTVTIYQPVCVATPPDGICKNCMMCTALAGPWNCNIRSEIQFAPAMGSMPPTVVCPLQGHPYLGGGVVPRPGGGILGGGVGPIFPWVIGISP